MKKLFFDIETLPAEKEKHEILREIHKRKMLKSKEPKTFEEFVEETGLDGAFGRICCISYAINDEPVKTISGDEKNMLKDFWEIAADINLFIGFNIMDFDFKFIFQRSVILGIKPTRLDLNFAKYRNFPIYDIIYEWSKWAYRSKVSLDTLAKALGLPSSKGGAIEGKNVAKAYEEGKIKEICKYCEADVELTRKIYKRMLFEE